MRNIFKQSGRAVAVRPVVFLAVLLFWFHGNCQDSTNTIRYSIAKQRMMEFMQYWKSPPVYLVDDVDENDFDATLSSHKKFFLNYFSDTDLNTFNKQENSLDKHWVDSLLWPQKVFCLSENEINKLRLNSTEPVVEMKCSNVYFNSNQTFAVLYFWWTDADNFAEGRLYIYQRYLSDDRWHPIDSEMVKLK